MKREPAESPFVGTFNVLHVNLAAPGIGGKERLLADFFDGLRDSEFRVSICSFDGGSTLGGELAGRGCRVWALEKEGGGQKGGRLRRLAGVLREANADIAHVHGIGPLLTMQAVGLIRPVPPIVFTCHFSRVPQAGVRRLVTAAALRRAAAIVAVSGAAADVMVRSYFVPPARMRLIPNGVNADRLAPTTKPDRVPATVGFCGVFRPEKQVENLVRAMAIVRQHEPGARLLLVGDGPSRESCVETARHLLLSAGVDFVGSQQDVRPWLDRMDIFVLPSRAEAMPVALLEAMAMGRAVLASRVGGVPEIVDDGSTGLLAPPDDVAHQAKMMLQLIRDPDLRVRLGNAARAAVVGRFSLARMMSSHASLYSSLLK